MARRLSMRARMAGAYAALTGRARDSAFPVAQRAYPKGESPFGTLGSGGAMNLLTGLGGPTDKGDMTFFFPTRLISRDQFEVTYVQSWAAKKFIDIPVDDMFARPRVFLEENEDKTAAFEQSQEELAVNEKLGRAIKCARLHGTGLLVILTKDKNTAKPLEVERLGEGDLVSLQVYDRWDAGVMTRDRNPLSPTFTEPEMYRISPRLGSSFEVHASRVIRFDGQKPLTTSGWSQYDQDWGVSELIPVLRSVGQDVSVTAAITHLTQEASIPVVKTQNFADAATGGGNLGPDEASVDEIAQRISELKSVWRTMFLDVNDEYTRVGVSFSGLPNLLDKFAQRLAAAADIPATRFFGQSPLGMNATGDSDLSNYALHVASMQKRMLTAPYRTLDVALARHAGLDQPPEYEFPSLIEIGDSEKVQVSNGRANAVATLVQLSILDENEAREILSGDDLFGSLDPVDPVEMELRAIDPMEMERMAMEKEKMGAEQERADREMKSREQEKARTNADR